MSKKIISYLMLLVAILFSTSAMAQLDELKNKSVTVGTAVDVFEPNTWYFLHQGRVSGGDGYCAYGESPSQGGFMTDMGSGEKIRKMSIENVEAESDATLKAAYLVRFIPGDTEGAYKIQFGTGRYLTAPAGTGNSKTITTNENPYDAGEYNIYAIDEEQPGYFALNVCDERGSFQELIDNNGVNETIVTWGSGQKTAVDGNSVWGIISIEWAEISDREALLNEFAAVLAEYDTYNFEAGTDPGQYDPELVAAFEAAMLAAHAADGPALDNLSDDQIRKLIDDIKAAYEAVKDAKNPMVLADGYYFIRTGLTYTTTQTDEETEEEVTVDVPKFMYSAPSGDKIGGFWGSPEQDCPKLWHVATQEDGTFDIVNVATEARFNNVARSTAVTMSAPGENMMAIDPVVTVEGITYVNIRVSTQAANDFLYLHQNKHNNGTGTGEALVGWSRTYSVDDGPKASEWFFVPVDEETAQQIITDYEPIKNHDLLLAQYDSILTNAKQNLAIAEDIQHVKLIQSADQLSSPYTEPSEGAIENLLDGNTTTFWHSNWSDGNVEGDIHYLQVDLVNPVDQDIYITFTRRPVSNDHVTQMIIRGTNDPEAEKEDCEELLIWDTPYGSNTESLTSDLFSTNGLRYIRLYAATTTNDRGYWHMTELQMGYDTENPNSQMSHMGDLPANLQAVIDEQADIERDDITLEDYNTLKAAYDAFMAKFVDPTELRETLENVKSTADMVVVGTDPGFWSADNGAGAFKTLYEAAVAYDASGDYTPEQSQSYVEQLTAQSTNIYESANKIQTGKWYRIRFGSEEEYEEYGWDKVAGKGNENRPDLFDKYASVATFFTEEGAEIIESIDPAEVSLGQSLHFLDENNLSDEDAALFRFVAVGDSAYMLQNKATNMFLKAAGTPGGVTLSVHPSLFTVRAIGYGQNAIAAKSITGDDQKFLHGQLLGNTLVTWGPDFEPYAGSRSGLFIEEAEDVASDYEGTDFQVALTEGSVNAFCFPVEISVKKGQNAEMWSVANLEGTKVTLSKVEKSAIGGRPFIIVYGNTEDYDAENADVTDMVTLCHGYDITATEPQDKYAFKGTYEKKVVGAGVIVAEGNTFVVSKKSTTFVSANSAYIAHSEPIADLSATVEVIFDATLPDGIQTALSNVTKSGAVYTIDGRLVSKNATLNDLQKFGKGLYILNGTKVIVK